MTGEGWVGRPLRRVEDRRFITGRGQYVDDVLRPRLLHLAFVRSPHAHARVVRLDASAAQSSPGVVTVLTGRDVPSFRPVSLMPFVPGIKAPTRPVLAGDTVHMVGELVAAVIARDPSEARDAAERVVVGYEPLDALPLAPAALKAPALGSDIPSKRVIAHRWNAGDAETAFRAAAHVERLTIDQNRVSAMTMEPRTVLAEYDPGTDLLTVWISIQSPFPFRAELARMLDFPEERIRVTAPDVGGGFGVKAGVYPEDVIVAYAALTLGRAVKWVSTRGEDFQSTTQGRGGACEAEIALAADGTITGLRARIVVPVGARLVASAAVPPGRYGNMMPGAYRVASVDIETNGVLTTTAPTGAYRGAGRPEAMSPSSGWWSRPPAASSSRSCTTGTGSSSPPASWTTRCCGPTTRRPSSSTARPRRAPSIRSGPRGWARQERSRHPRPSSTPPWLRWPRSGCRASTCP